VFAIAQFGPYSERNETILPDFTVRYFEIYAYLSPVEFSYKRFPRKYLNAFFSAYLHAVCLDLLVFFILISRQCSK
jgi:hypothetical protein